MTAASADRDDRLDALGLIVATLRQDMPAISAVLDLSDNRQVAAVLADWASCWLLRIAVNDQVDVGDLVDSVRWWVEQRAS